MLQRVQGAGGFSQLFLKSVLENDAGGISRGSFCPGEHPGHAGRASASLPLIGSPQNCGAWARNHHAASAAWLRPAGQSPKVPVMPGWRLSLACRRMRRQLRRAASSSVGVILIPFDGTFKSEPPPSSPWRSMAGAKHPADAASSSGRPTLLAARSTARTRSACPPPRGRK